jgi:iron complex outermembrane recepter protein
MLFLVLALALSGTVRSPDGAPIAAAHVTARTPDGVATATTDATGRFALDVPALPVDLDVTAAGFAPVHRRVARSPVEIVLAPASVAESVVVAADRPAAWRDPMTGATVLARADLETVPAVTPDEALRVISGFSLFRRSTARASNPTTHGVTMRGLSASGASRGLVTLDGVPLNDGFGGWVTWTRLPPDAIARIDVLRGAEGEAFGSDALGGVISIVTRTGDSPALLGGGEAGSTGVGGADVSGGGRHGPASLFGAASWFHTDGVIPVAPESQGPVDRPADADWVNAFGRLDAGGGGRLLTVSGLGGRDDRGNGTVLQRNRMSGGTVTAAGEVLGSRTTIAVRASFSPNHFEQTFTAVASSRASERLTSTQRIETGTTRLVAEAGRSVSRGHVLARAELSRAHADFATERSSGTETLPLRDAAEALSVQAGFAPAARLTVNGGVRRAWRAAPTRADARDAATVGRLGAAWQAAGHVTVRGSVATSHRWPTLNELVRDFQVGSVLTLANAGLRPERALSADLAVEVDGPLWQIAAGGFRTVVSDAIANVTLPSGVVAGFTGIVRQRRNAGDTHATGVELDADVRPARGLRLRGSASFTSATFRGPLEPALNGNRLPQVPRASGSGSVDVPLPRAASASLVWHGVSPQFDDDRNQYLLSAASEVDVQVTGRIGRARWMLAVENLFDNRIEVGRTPLVTLAPGRAVRVGLHWGR